MHTMVPLKEGTLEFHVSFGHGIRFRVMLYAGLGVWGLGFFGFCSNRCTFSGRI